MSETISEVKNVKPIKDRIALVPVEEKFDGIIIIPKNANQYHKLGRIVSLGSGVSIDAKEGDIVLYQVNRMFETAITHLLGKKRVPVMIMHEGDAIAKLSGQKVTLSEFTVLGDFILVKDRKIEEIGGILLPQNAQPAPEFEAVQVGNTVAASDADEVVSSIKPGDTLFLDRSRINAIRIDNKDFHYVLKHGVQGVYSD